MTNPKLTKQVLSALNPNSYLKQDQGKMLGINKMISEQKTKGNKMLASVGKSTVNAWQKTKKKGSKLLNRFSLKKKKV